MTAFGALIVATSAILGQSDTTKEDLKEVGNILVGEWVMESTTQVAIEGVCNVGDKFVWHSTCEWVADKSALLDRRSYEINGKTALEGVNVIGWDPATSRICSVYFDSSGGHIDTTWKKTGEGFVLRHSGTAGDGRKLTSKEAVTVSADQNTITVKVTDQVIGDQELKDRELVIRRVKK